MRGDDEVLSLEAERFERRLREEISGARDELHEQIAAVRGEIGAFRLELHDSLAGVRREIADVRVELLKWSFLFWIGQVAAIAGLLAFMLPGGAR